MVSYYLFDYIQAEIEDDMSNSYPVEVISFNTYIRIIGYITSKISYIIYFHLL